MSNVPNEPANLITASGAVTPVLELNFIDAGAAVALTVAAPVCDGQVMNFTDETGHLHTIVLSPTINGGTTSNKLTFGGAAGDGCAIVSQNGAWFTLWLNGVTVS